MRRLGRKSIRRIGQMIGKHSSRLAMLLCGCITLGIFAASYETVFNADLPFVNAVHVVDIRPLARVTNNFGAINQSQVGDYGKPQFMKVPAKGAKVVLAPAIYTRQGTFLGRANAGHLLLTSAPHNGQIGNATVYMRTSWRTFADANNLKVGDNIFVDTDREWRYFYRIDDVQTVGVSETYIARQQTASQLLLVTAADNARVDTVIAASLVNVQNVKL